MVKAKAPAASDAKPVRKPHRRSPYQRDAIEFRKAQQSIAPLTSKSVMHLLIAEAAKAASKDGEKVSLQSGVVEMIDGLLDQYLHNNLFLAGGFVRASGRKRLDRRQLAVVMNFNKSEGKGPRWPRSSIRKLRVKIGLDDAEE